MSKPTPNLLVVFNRAEEDEVCRLFLPFWKRSGCDILCSSPLNAPSTLAGVIHYHAGQELPRRRQEARRRRWWYQSRVLDTMKYCLLLDYEGFVFTQYDSICLGPLPRIRPGDSIHRFAGGEAPGFKSRFFLHPPWCFGKERLHQFVEAASTCDIQLTENGIMDRWLSLIIEEQCMPFICCNWAWSVNSIDTPDYVACARQAIASGCLFIHGVKNKQQLDAILAP
jgi:hypothetical protein